MRKRRVTLGIDLRRPSRSVFATLCLLGGDGTARYATAADPAELRGAVSELHPAAVAVGSPLTDAPPASGARAAVTALRKLEHNRCLNPRFAPPPLAKTASLAARGAGVAGMLKGSSPRMPVIETHPAAVLEFLGLPRPDEGLAERAILARAGIRKSSASSGAIRGGRELNALVAAVTALLHLGDGTLAFGDAEDGGSIHLPQPRRVRLAVLDVDGTLTDVRSPWRHVHETLGLWREHGEGILARYLEGGISYDRFCALDVGLWNAAGADLNGICSILDAIAVRPQALELLRGLHTAGIAVAMISTGFRRVAERIARAAGLDGRVEIVANDLGSKRDGIEALVNVSNDAGSQRSKGAHLRRLLSRLGVSPIETLAVGDGPSDRELFERSAQSLLVERPGDLLEALSTALGTA